LSLHSFVNEDEIYYEFMNAVPLAFDESSWECFIFQQAANLCGCRNGVWHYAGTTPHWQQHLLVWAPRQGVLRFSKRSFHDQRVYIDVEDDNIDEIIVGSFVLPSRQGSVLWNAVKQSMFDDEVVSEDGGDKVCSTEGRRFSTMSKPRSILVPGTPSKAPRSASLPGLSFSRFGLEVYEEDEDEQDDEEVGNDVSATSVNNM